MAPDTLVRLTGHIDGIESGAVGRVVGVFKQGDYEGFAVRFTDGVWGVREEDLAPLAPVARSSPLPARIGAEATLH